MKMVFSFIVLLSVTSIGAFGGECEPQLLDENYECYERVADSCYKSGFNHPRKGQVDSYKFDFIGRIKQIWQTGNCDVVTKYSSHANSFISSGGTDVERYNFCYATKAAFLDLKCR